MTSRIRALIVTVLASVFTAACADSPMSPTQAELRTLTPNFSLGTGTRNPAWHWGAKNRDTISVRALDYANGITKIEVAVGSQLLGPYPLGKHLDKITVIESPKPAALHLVTNNTLDDAQYYLINSTRVRAGMDICVNVHFRGASGIDPKLNANATEHINVCLTVVYAADVAVQSINFPATVSFLDRPRVITANVAELMANVPATFDCVLRINGELRGTLPGVELAAGEEGICEFDYQFQNPGSYTITVTAENVAPGDANPTNNAQSRETTLNVVIPGDENGGPGSETGEVLLPFCCNYFANEQYDTVFTRRQWQTLDGTVIADSGFVEYKVFHDSYLLAFWSSPLQWPLAKVAVAHQTGSLLFDNQVKTDVHAGGTGQCFHQVATDLVFGFTLCGIPFPFPGFLDGEPMFGKPVTRLEYAHAFNPSAPVRVDVNPAVIEIFTGAIPASGIRSVIAHHPLPPDFTGGVPAYNGTIDFIISIESAPSDPPGPRLVSGSGFNLHYTFGSDHPNWLRFPRQLDSDGGCPRIPQANGTFLRRCTWQYSVWGRKEGAGTIGNVF